jgi:hypothetical protein
MLQALVPARFALAGGLLFALHGNLMLGWGQSYWGGAPAVLGAALLFGGAAHSARRCGGAGPPLALAAGAVILANTRPYEGLLAAGAAAVWLAARLGPGGALRRVAPGLLAVGLPAAAAMAAYNARVTGEALRAPYQVHQATYGATPLFLFQERPPEPSYPDASLRRFHVEWEGRDYERQRTLAGLVATKGAGLFAAWLYLLGPLLTLPVLLGARCRGAARPALLGLGILVAGALPVTWLQPHYLAPAVPLLLLLAVEGLRRLAAWRRAAGRGRLLAALFLALFAFVFAAAAERYASLDPAGWGAERARVAADLEARPGRDLVIVAYGAGHDPLAEWVYNAADFEGAEIVWARDLGTAANARLRERFADRAAWWLEADAPHPEPRRLREAEAP